MSMEQLDPEATVAAPGGGILGRFENVRERKSCKRAVQCAAATPAFTQHDYLKPVHLPVDRVDQEANYAPTSNINETKFHKGFARRHKADIQPDAARMEAEIMRSQNREDLARASVAATIEAKDKYTFNLLTGEGVGRECEFRQVGKKIVNPFGCMEAVYAEHGRDAGNRLKNSKHRFFDHTSAEPSRERQQNIFNEGLQHTKRETAILGYGNAGVRRVRGQSCGTSDNFAHLRALPPEPSYENSHYGNYSQIILG